MGCKPWLRCGFLLCAGLVVCGCQSPGRRDNGMFSAPPPSKGAQSLQPAPQFPTIPPSSTTGPLNPVPGGSPQPISFGASPPATQVQSRFATPAGTFGAPPSNSSLAPGNNLPPAMNNPSLTLPAGGGMASPYGSPATGAPLIAGPSPGARTQTTASPLPLAPPQAPVAPFAPGSP